MKDDGSGGKEGSNVMKSISETLDLESSHPTIVGSSGLVWSGLAYLGRHEIGSHYS